MWLLGLVLATLITIHYFELPYSSFSSFLSTGKSYFSFQQSGIISTENAKLNPPQATISIAPVIAADDAQNSVSAKNGVALAPMADETAISYASLSSSVPSPSGLESPREPGIKQRRLKLF